MRFLLSCQGWKDDWIISLKKSFNKDNSCNTSQLFAIQRTCLVMSLVRQLKGSQDINLVAGSSNFYTAYTIAINWKSYWYVHLWVQIIKDKLLWHGAAIQCLTKLKCAKQMVQSRVAPDLHWIFINITIINDITRRAWTIYHLEYQTLVEWCLVLFQ